MPGVRSIWPVLQSRETQQGGYTDVAWWLVRSALPQPGSWSPCSVWSCFPLRLSYMVTQQQSLTPRHCTEERRTQAENNMISNTTQYKTQWLPGENTWVNDNQSMYLHRGKENISWLLSALWLLKWQLEVTPKHTCISSQITSAINPILKPHTLFK